MLYLQSFLRKGVSLGYVGSICNLKDQTVVPKCLPDGAGALRGGGRPAGKTMKATPPSGLRKLLPSGPACPHHPSLTSHQLAAFRGEGGHFGGMVA